MGDVNLSTVIRAALTGLLIVVAVLWLFVVFGTLDNAPQKDASGNVTVDEFQRSKDILLVVVPLLTTALGYWFGAAGREQAETKADDAEKRAAGAETRTQKVKDQLVGVLDSSSEPDLIERAKQKYPAAFD